ncbi:MAG: hypothetical protein KA974_03575 [Saprospiraceae bacterium]|nr:hypothetical protein [Saprospiraceae bacterium]MBP7680186.1 hypothetical protein [Saprospiraceae bacterium]
MKTRLVMWGSNAQNEKVLVALNLRAEDNKVDIYTFPEVEATEDFVNQMHQEWRNGKQLNFPTGYTTAESELTVSGAILPEGITIERPDLIQRAQSEWHFVVLSTKLHESYSSELNLMKDKVEQLASFSDDVWNDLKGFWDKVQDQLRERNLFREHADTLRDETNTLFVKLKGLRKAVDEEFHKLSKEKYTQFSDMIDNVEKRIAENGARANGLFDELKSIQGKFKDIKDISREHRSKIWERIDNAFKVVKEARFGADTQGGEATSNADRLSRRMDGLMAAIAKMEESIARDKEELDYQTNRVTSTHGQLEAQLRQAKMSMIEERIRSKEEKLKEMHATKIELDTRIVSTKEKDAKREEREREREKVEAAKKAAEGKIAATMQQAADERAKHSDKIEKAAETVGATAAEDTASVGAAIEEVIGAAKAVANAVEEKIEQIVDAVSDAVTDTKDEIAAKEDTKEA